ncbi:type VI secretion system baseplate subunit TssG [Yersinia kristensenii]|uniref:Type VI secretion protein n=1 Tax=Yersinia kristensenii TaxID=28152 RepID=A0A0T9L3U5_YERKR|nr:type VI secretion system baseplate subunit TssG [Yersinia kristensenii]MDA5523692.1 type VI secretion system baseplate subunit TssG [Yersinia kristensenii]MDR4896781.1 type VI secretion system baseplate subunit TssG [Yersinia kristensenii]MDX6734494.1 type VI secretion system baseplate subunit TssG [Yersinia kristensenii]OVZ78960.1 type VI secretion protein [Yersinia kristensenii]PHZ36766.1 type VI secretion protein [Yersinia kristensenii]
MARDSQPARTGLTQALSKDIWRVNFYRFCQLLEQAAPNSPLLGATCHPENDPVRFRPWPGMGFPVSELKKVETDEDNPDLPPTVRTTFLGMYGVDSPLPGTYLDDISQRREGHEALTAFLDIFSHRITTQYYRIWRKYAYPATFEAGGTDATSQCLLGLVGLGIPGTAEHVATPVSRFLALLGTMRLPTRNAEGIRALVNLLAPDSEATVIQHDPVKIQVTNRSGLGRENRVTLSQRATLGKTAKEANSRVLVTLSTCNPTEADGWLPGGALHTDLLALMRVYLGYRSDVRLRLTVPVQLLPEPRLGKNRRIQLGRTGLLGLKNGKLSDNRQFLTVSLGCYEGLACTFLSPAKDGHYRFE